MIKKIKDLTVEDIKECFGNLFSIDEACCVLFMKAAMINNDELLETFKRTVPEEILNKEIEIDND